MVPILSKVLFGQVIISPPAFDTGNGFTVIFDVSYETQPIRVVVSTYVVKTGTVVRFELVNKGLEILTLLKSVPGVQL